MKYRDFPIHLEIESTNKCNLTCIMCPHRSMKRKQTLMSWDIFRRIIDEALQYNVKSSYVHMIGEPLLNPLILDMINALDKLEIHTSISTNAMLLNKLYSHRIFSFSRLKELILCLDGIDKKTYDKYRIGGDFNLVKRQIDECIEMRRKLKSCQTEVVVQIIKMKGNEHQFQTIQQEYEKKLQGIGRVWIKEFSRFAGFVPDLGDVKTNFRRTWCSKLRTHMAIQADGDFVICCRDFEKMTVIGNINKMSMYNAWHSARYNNYRAEFDFKKWTNPLCKDC